MQCLIGRPGLLIKNFSMTIRAVCFDLDGVYFTPQGKESFHQALSQEFGADPEAVDQFMYRSETMGLLVRGELTNEEFCNRLREELNIDVSDTDIINRWIQDYEIDQQVREVVQTVKQHGYQTCVCTNNNGLRLSALEEKFDFCKDFDVVVSSHWVGHCKPSQEIYQALLERLQVAPEELLYSDDNPDRLDGARELGIECFVYENLEQCIRELHNRGIDIGVPQ